MSAAGVFVVFLTVAFPDLVIGTFRGFALQPVRVLTAALILITHERLLSEKSLSNYAYTLPREADPVNAPQQRPGTHEAPF